MLAGFVSKQIRVPPRLFGTRTKVDVGTQYCASNSCKPSSHHSMDFRSVKKGPDWKKDALFVF